MLYHKTYINESSDKWVTFIHGAGGSSRIWSKQLESFRQEYNVLLVDLRGHGKSNNLCIGNIKKYTFRFITGEVKEVLDYLEIKKSHFVGISLGSIIIRELAEICPERIDKMIMGGAILKMNFKSQVLMKLGLIFKSVLPYIVLYKILAWVIMPKQNHKKSRNIFIREARRLYQKEFIRWFKLTKTINPLLKIFRNVDPKIPTLYVMGEQDYMFLPAVKMIVEKHKSAVLNIIPDCGHVVNIDRPKVFNTQVLEYLRQ